MHHFFVMKIFTLVCSLLGCMLVSARNFPRAVEKDFGILLNGPHHIPRDTATNYGHPVVLAQSPAIHGSSHSVSHIAAATVDVLSTIWAELVRKEPAPGTITFISHNTGQKVAKEIDAPPPDFAIHGHTAEWIMDKVTWDPQGNPLTNFGAIHWINCYAESKPVGGGDIMRYDLLGSTKVHLLEGDTIWTDVAILGPNDFWLAWKPHHI